MTASKNNTTFMKNIILDFASIKPSFTKPVANLYDQLQLAC